MFLKFLDGHGQVREKRVKMKREKYRPAIEAPVPTNERWGVNMGCAIYTQWPTKTFHPPNKTQRFSG
jgi:hypothetical protein